MSRAILAVTEAAPSESRTSSDSGLAHSMDRGSSVSYDAAIIGDMSLGLRRSTDRRTSDMAMRNAISGPRARPTPAI